MSFIPDARQQLRSLIRSHRRGLSVAEQQLAGKEILVQIQQHPRIQSADRIALFQSFDGELPTQPLIDLFWQQGKRVFLPVIHPFASGHLLFTQITAQTLWIPHRFGMSQPKLDVRHIVPTDALQIILTPLVAFDAQGNRLGMGGGYYDRTLHNWQKRGIYPIGLAHNCQQVERINAEEWDVPLPEIITPAKHWRWQSCF